MRGCPECPRNIKDCIPLDNILSDDGSYTFICVGLNSSSSRSVEQDYLTLCVKNNVIDTREHCDRLDLSDQLAVIAGSLSMDDRIGTQTKGDHHEFLKQCMDETHNDDL